MVGLKKQVYLGLVFEIAVLRFLVLLKMRLESQHDFQQ